MRPDREIDEKVGYLTQRFAEALNSGDPVLLAAAFEPGAIVAGPPGNTSLFGEQPLAGPGFEGLDAQLGAVLVADDLAILLVNWTMSTIDDEVGERTVARGRSCDIARRSADGAWRVAIDNGAGSGPAEAPLALGEDDSTHDVATGRVVSRLRDAIRVGEVSSRPDLFEESAIVAVAPGVTVSAADATAAFAAYADIADYHSTIRHAYLFDDLAHVITDWRVTGPEGTTQSEGTSADVVRRGADGRWRYAIHNRFGSTPYRDSVSVEPMRSA